MDHYPSFRRHYLSRYLFFFFPLLCFLLDPGDRAGAIWGLYFFYFDYYPYSVLLSLLSAVNQTLRRISCIDPNSDKSSIGVRSTVRRLSTVNGLLDASIPYALTNDERPT